MTGHPSSRGHRPGEFAETRAQAEVDARTQRTKAARTVAGQARNDDDRRSLLSMLGLEDTSEHPSGTEAVSLRELERGMAGYLQAVATALKVPADATGFEISDTITAYLGLPDRIADCPNHDLMLVWNEQDGWLVAAEYRPTEPLKVIGYLGGQNILPHPYTVAQFVVHLLSGHHPPRFHPIHPIHTSRTGADLAALLRHYRAPATSHRTNSLS